MNPNPQKPTAQASSLSLKAILLVDDDRQLAAALQWILADENFLVDMAHDGDEAMLKVRAHEYDVVVCDIMMPRVRGDEFYLKATDFRPSLADRFIFITGFSMNPEIQDFFAGNDVKFLQKPFQMNELIVAVKALLSGVR